MKLFTTGLVAMCLLGAMGATVSARADWDDWNRRDWDWRRDHRAEEWREHHRSRGDWDDYGRWYAPPPVYTAPPAYGYYAPPPAYYGVPSFSFGVTVR